MSMMITQWCDCEKGKSPKAMIRTTFMEGAPRTEANLMIQCDHCNKILKYFGTVAAIDPRTGLRHYRTVMI